MMARVGLLGRIMLVLLGALSLLVVATFGIDQWQRGQERSPYATRFPRLDQAGSIMALLRDSDPAQRPAILRAINGEALRADIVDAPPDETALIREPVLEARLHRLTGDAGDAIRAFTSADMLYRGNGPADAGTGSRRKSIGSLAVATYRLPDGRTLVVSAITRHRSLMPWLLGQPLSLWVAVLGLVVAGLVTIGARHELGPLRRLTEAVSRFDGRASEFTLAQQGAPEIRRLAQAVQEMQERIVGLMGERSMLIGAISHDLKTYLTRMRLLPPGRPVGRLRPWGVLPGRFPHRSLRPPLLAELSPPSRDPRRPAPRRTSMERVMIRKLIVPLALASGVLLASPAAEARDGCGPGFHRGYYGWCRPNWRPYAYRPFVYGPGYCRFGYRRWGGYRWHYRYRYSWHRSWHRGFAWHGGHRWSGFRHGGWHRRF